MITQTELQKLFNYDPETGHFKNLIYRGPRAQIGHIAGSLHKSGYVEIWVCGKKYMAHQLAFIYMTGNCPEEIDHEDRVKSNNKWSNLREASHTENMQNRSVHINNTSGCPGVYWDKKGSTWRVQIYVDGKKLNVGSNKDFDEAVQMRKDAIARHFKDFASF